MSISRKDILKRIRYGRRVRYGDDWGDVDPQYAHLYNPEKPRTEKEEAQRLSKLPEEQQNATNLLRDYIPRKYGIGYRALVDMTSEYMNNRKLHHGFHQVLSEDYTNVKHLPPAGSLTQDLVNTLRRQKYPDKQILGMMGYHINMNNLQEDAHHYLTRTAGILSKT